MKKVKGPFEIYKFDVVNDLYDRTYWNKIESNIINEVDEMINKQVPKELIEQQVIEYKEWEQAHKNYVKAISNRKYKVMCFLRPLGYLFFVYPGIILNRKIKEIEKQQKNDLSIKKKEEADLLMINSLISAAIHPWSIYLDMCEKYLHYYDAGSITNTFYDVIGKYWPSIESTKMLKNNEFRNTLNSSYGIFNNSIIANINYKKHRMVDMTYYGYRTLSYNIGNQINSVILQASVTRKVPVFDITCKTWCFTLRNPNLRFFYDGYFKGTLFDKKDNNPNYHRFENPNFEKHYLFERNDEVGIRTIFTPAAQENFLRMSNNGPLPPELQISKKGYFYGTNYDCSCITNNFINDDYVIKRFSVDPFYKIGHFKKDIIMSIMKLIKTRYNSIAFMTALPIIQSEDQTDIINDINKERFNNTNISQGDVNQAFYIINQLYNPLLLGKLGIFKILDSESFQYIDNLDNIKKYKTDSEIVFTSALMNSYTYEAQKFIEEIHSSNGGGLGALVPVVYYEYNRKNSEALLFYAPVSRNIFIHSPSCHNLSDSSLSRIKNEFIKKHKDKFNMATLKAKNGQLAIFANTTYRNNSDDLAKYFKQLVDYLNSEENTLLDSFNGNKVLQAMIAAEFYKEKMELEEYEKSLEEKRKEINDSIETKKEMK